MKDKIKVNMVINPTDGLKSMYMYPDGRIFFRQSTRYLAQTTKLIEGYSEPERSQLMSDLSKCKEGVYYSREELLEMGTLTQSLLLECDLMLEEIASNKFTLKDYITSDNSRRAKNKITENNRKPYVEKILANKVVLELIEELKDFPTAMLVGGAVVDIIDGRTPKDYDIIVDDSEINILNKLSLKPDFEFLYNSPSSTTFLFKKKYEVQFIKSKSEDFYFLNERNSFILKDKRFGALFTSLIETKMLAVNSEAMLNQRFTASQFGIRVRHWERKGYKISDVSYDSAIRKADREPNTSKNS